MLTVNALETNPDLSDDDILDLLSSNLCRCTGYQNIIKAVRSTVADMRRQAPFHKIAAAGPKSHG